MATLGKGSCGHKGSRSGKETGIDFAGLMEYLEGSLNGCHKMEMQVKGLVTEKAPSGAFEVEYWLLLGMGDKDHKDQHFLGRLRQILLD